MSTQSAVTVSANEPEGQGRSSSYAMNTRDPLNKFDNDCNHWIYRDGKGGLARLVCAFCGADAWLDQTPMRYGSPDTLDMSANHGTITAYFNWRCRCDECVAEGRRYSRERKADQRWVQSRRRVLYGDS